jgi:protein-S-isoprenylcysteine O-methyltransferase Ste14
MAEQRWRSTPSMLARHIVSAIVLPGTVAVTVPAWIARRNGVTLRAPTDVAGVLLIVAGAGALCVGLALFVASLRRFASQGQGTLAPWDPPRRLVVRGPYRYVRNPMIASVNFIVFGEALVLRSWPHALWALAFLAMNLGWIPLYEEPQLERRFGDDYRAYRRNVPRFFPRLRPWDGVTAPDTRRDNFEV